MPCFVIVTYPDGHNGFSRSFTDRAEAVAYIRNQLGYKSLIASAATYRIFHWESGEMFNEDNPPK